MKRSQTRKVPLQSGHYWLIGRAQLWSRDASDIDARSCWWLREETSIPWSMPPHPAGCRLQSWGGGGGLSGTVNPGQLTRSLGNQSRGKLDENVNFMSLMAWKGILHRLEGSALIGNRWSRREKTEPFVLSITSLQSIFLTFVKMESWY